MRVREEGERKMFAVDECILLTDVNVYAFKLYVWLWAICNEGLQVYNSCKSLAATLNMCEGSVKKGLKELKKNKLISIEPRYLPNGGKDTNLITILKTKPMG